MTAAAAAAMGEGVAPSQSPYVSEPLPAAPSLQTQTQSPAPGTPILEEASADAAMKKRKMQKVAALALAQSPTFEEEEEQGEEAVLAAATARKKHKEHSSSPSLSAAAAAETPTMEQETEVIKKPKRSKEEEEEPPGHSPLPPGQAQSQGTKAPHASKPLPAATFLEALAQSPAPGTPMLEEVAAAVMSKRNICKEQKVPELSLAQITTLEEPRDDAMAAKMESNPIKHTLSSPSTSVAAETTFWEQEVKVTKKQKHSKDQEPSSYLPLPPDPGETQPQGSNAPHASKPLSAAPFREATAQSPAPGTPMLKEAAAAMMRKRKICKEQKVPDLYLAQNTSLEEQREDAMEAKMKKESKNMEHTLSSCSTSVAAENTIWKQELKVTKKQKQRKQQEPSSKSPLQLDPGHTHCVRSQGGKAPPKQEREAGGRMGSSITINNGKRPRVLSKRELIKEASKKKPVLPEGFVPFTDFASSCTEQNPDHSSAYSAFFDQFRYNPVREDHKPPLLRTPDRVARLPSRGHSSLESSLGTPMLEEASAAVMSKRNICKEQKVPELSLSQITTLEEPRDDALAAKMKESKHIKHTLSSPSTSVAAETTIWEQEVKVTKKQKHSKDQELSSYSLMPLDPGQTQPQGTNAPHASKPLSAAPFREATAQSAAPGTPMLKEAAAAIMRKRKISKEQKLPDLSLAQNTSLEEQREDAVEAKMKKESKNMEHTLSSYSTSVAAETTIWKQELKVTKKQKQRKQQEPSRKSPLQLDPGHTHCVRSQGGKAPPEQEREAGGRMGSSIKINNGKRPRVLSKRELIKEASKKKPVLPEGFVPFTDFASSCTEQNRDHSSAYSAFFDQFRYNPVLEDHKPPLLRTPDRVARLPSRGHSSLESSPLTANETSRAAKFNTSVASKGKQLESGSGSQEKLNLDVKENTQKKKREKKQREPSGNTLPFDPSQTCCIQLHKAPPEQYQGADAPKVDNVKNGNCKKAHVCAPSKRKLFKEMNKEQVLPEGFLAPSDFVPNCTEQSPNYTSPSAASLYQFCYRPACQDRNPQPPGTTDRLSMMPPRGYPSFELSELFANGTSKASKANNSLARKLKKKDSGSGSSYGSQEKLHAKEKKNPKKKMGTTKQREPPPLLTPAEKCSDKYRRVSLDQLVPPPRSPHNLLQEEYASDPWKVIVICMLLNLTHGKQVKNIIEGFFECYPDAQSAVNADPEKMAGYLAYLGLQRVKTTRIQKFSKEYVEKEWTYITELCGVGKYAADAYAIFCAGRATEVVPKDHKLVDYWKYVCFELPMMQESKTCRKLQ